MNIKQTEAAIEAILFASGEPISVKRLADTVEVEEETVYKICKTLQDRKKTDESGICIVELNDSFQMCTNPDFADYIKKALEIKKNIPLSQAAMEVLAIIAYNQPVTKSFVEQVRGVESSQIVNNLVEKGLVEEAGRLDVPGRPISYKTSINFLRCFGLSGLDKLPPLPDENGQVMLDEVVEDYKLAEEQSVQEEKTAL
ncbi:MAG: SMC-Scp complex subunit ScpB [Clostridiales bacterium]|nr:SMC-Scp complex subunit ScpB [Clostridiales bacterium]